MMKKAFFFGDSNTYGYDPAGFMGGRYPKEQRWTTMLAKNLAGIWRIEADGLPGRALPVTGYEWKYLRSLLQEHAPVDLFGVMLGTNDILGTLRPDAAQAARRMDDLITFVEEALGMGSAETSPDSEGISQQADILLIAPPRICLTDQSFAEPYVTGDRSFSQVYREEGERLTQYYRELAAYRGIRFVDASAWELDFAFDGVHLSESGHAVFAAEMVDVLRRIWDGPAHSCESCAAVPRGAE